ncbi:MAG: prolipoprotein diacylglyceryl transferase [Alphaproteobacteria bacterium]|nr:MAG: prolipoprotein diacylglyceryl transferase [Alphaproteobacteria bacterium]TAF14086.1 MAG: prolipoprotein diacylglyceryl transferase [Alphaproteobacteria bacterium]TAF41424.1 MAG: prolipoprotein diacylglyceryl transferase [Alphaproteobacteria bacterium]TAF75407.1 MAG: prolipoprotein diacylglyceryl transferase [Alphaproteobacteria bacterium]
MNYAALALTFPNIDPIAIAIGPLAIRWYALAYIAGIMGAWWYIGWIERKRPPALLNKLLRDDMIVYGVLGVVLGGRLGYTLFYNLPYYLEHPLDMLKMWNGGMSFHGGTLGVIIAFFVFSRVKKIPYLGLMDRICCAVPIGLFFGRLANFINGELYGRMTDSEFGMVFPHGGPFLRHPSQLYEAALEGAVLFVILFVLAVRTRALHYPSLLSGVFLLGYGTARFMVEFVREPDEHLGLLNAGLSMGQWLCVPMIVIGCGLIIWALRRGKKPRFD